uniref:DUF2513 domain-containing protein n=1 Tax=Gemmiger formicilis TaxID=745368 RepID=UPI003FF0E63D
MRLNMDCLRDTLLALEDGQRFYVTDENKVAKDSLSLENVCALVPKYDKAEVFYALRNLEQAGMIDMTARWTNGFVYYCCVNDVLYEGHQFADKIRDETRWCKLKKGMSAVRDYSLSAIEAIAEGMTSAAIAAYLTKA